jgi:hypothetical protein
MMLAAELRQLVQGRPDGHGECDGCHREGMGLWELPDEPGAYQMCLDCMARIIKARTAKERRDNAKLA